MRTGDVAEDVGSEEEETGWGEVDTDTVFGDLHATLTDCLSDLGRITSLCISLCFPLCTSSSF